MRPPTAHRVKDESQLGTDLRSQVDKGDSDGAVFAVALQCRQRFSHQRGSLGSRSHKRRRNIDANIANQLCRAVERQVRVLRPSHEQTHNNHASSHLS